MTKSELEAEVERLTAELETAKAYAAELETQLTEANRAVPAVISAEPARSSANAPHWCSLFPEPPDDPRPEFDLVLGWETPAVLEWGARQKSKQLSLAA